MKSTKTILAVFLVPFATSVVASMYVATRIVEVANSEVRQAMELHVDLYEQAYDQEYLLGVSISHINAALAEDYEKILFMNCLISDLALKNLNPELIENQEHRERLEAQAEEARALIADLEKDGSCPIERLTKGKDEAVGNGP